MESLWASMHFIRNKFLTGILILIPLVATYWLVGFLLEILSGVGAPVMRTLFGPLTVIDDLAWVAPVIALANIFLALAFIFLLGLIGTNFVGRRVLATVNAILLRVPLISSVYGAVQQMVQTIQGPSGSFQRVVLVEYPRKGMWVMGLVAAIRDDVVGLTSGNELLSVFVPTTPNPTSGFLVMVPPEDVIEVDYTVEEAFKFVVSSGIVGHNFERRTVRNGNSEGPI